MSKYVIERELPGEEHLSVGEQRTQMRLSEPNPIEDQIKSFEQEAQEKYYTAFQNMQAVALSDKFNRLLELRIMPTLVRIGFDKQLCRAACFEYGSGFGNIHTLNEYKKRRA